MNNVFHKPSLHKVEFLDQRYYQFDNQTYLPSVTTILEVFPKGFGFDQWLKDVGSNAKQIADRAADSGSRVHNAIEDLVRGVEICWQDEFGHATYTIQEWEMICKFMQFWTKHKPELLASETQVYSLRHGCAGTIDLVVRINGIKYLIDVKTSNYIHTSQELQLSAYATMWNENTEDIVDKTAILWLKAQTRGEDKRGKCIQGEGWQLKEFDRHYTNAFEVFKHAKAIWDEENPDPKPKFLSFPDRLKLDVSAAIKHVELV